VPPEFDKYLVGDLFGLRAGLYHLQHERINAPVISTKDLCECSFITPCDQTKKFVICILNAAGQIDNSLQSAKDTMNYIFFQ